MSESEDLARLRAKIHNLEREASSASAGAQGPQGSKGDKGDTGAQGPKGDTGDVNPLAAYPVGAIYLSVVNTSPATLFGGTWVAFGAGRVLVGYDAGDSDFNAAEETGGAKTVQASAQTFSGTALGTHQHAAISAGTPAGTVGAISATATAAQKIGTSTASAAAQTHTHPAPTFTGSALATHQHAAITAGTPAGTNTPGAATSVLQPYITVFMWKRTA